MEYVTYENVNPKLQIPTFELDESKNIPFLDYTDINSPNYNIGTNSNLYDDLLNDLQTNSSEPQNSLDVTSMNLLSAIQNHLGETYNNARRLDKGYSDCSGFVNKVFKDLGIDLKGASSIYMYNNLTDHINFDQVRPGDLVFLTPKKTHSVAGTRRRAGIDSSHVAIVVEKQGTKIKVAENTGSKRKSDFCWYELGDPNAKSGNGVINYSKGNTSGVKNQLLGFGRIRV